MNQFKHPMFPHPSWMGNIRILISILFFLTGFNAFAQQPNKIQRVIDAVKAVNNNEDDDYITDGQRVVWVKSYKKWTPEDLVVMKKEDTATLKFLGMAAQRARYDVLEQLLPDYYWYHGGVKAFAVDILKANQNNNVTGANASDGAKDK